MAIPIDIDVWEGGLSETASLCKLDASQELPNQTNSWLYKCCPRDLANS